jgi:hypothetical protein
MKPTYLALALIVVFLLIGNTVIPDRLMIEFNPISTEIVSHAEHPADLDHANAVVINVKSIVILFCVGFIGIVVFSRKRIGDKNNEKNITS